MIFLHILSSWGCFSEYSLHAGRLVNLMHQTTRHRLCEMPVDTAFVDVADLAARCAGPLGNEYSVSLWLLRAYQH